MNGERIDPKILQQIAEAEERVSELHEKEDRGLHESGILHFGPEDYKRWLTTPHPELDGMEPHTLLLDDQEYTVFSILNREIGRSEKEK